MILSKAYTAMGLCMSYDRDSASELFSTIQEGDLQHAMAILSDKPKLINATISCSHTRFSLLHYAATHGQSEVIQTEVPTSTMHAYSKIYMGVYICVLIGNSWLHDWECVHIWIV
jgi:hypothetical protein